MIGIIDCGTGNITSVKNALIKLGEETKVVTGGISEFDKIILPGVGAFGFMMESLRKKKVDIEIKEFIQSGKPFLGICLGMQVLFEESEESPGIKGLEILKGKVVRFKEGKVPQVGWNKIENDEEYAYFVNSYYAVPEEKSIIKATSDYYVKFPSSIRYGNITAFQFHPEKSGKYGLKLIERWLKC